MEKIIVNFATGIDYTLDQIDEIEKELLNPISKAELIEKLNRLQRSITFIERRFNKVKNVLKIKTFKRGTLEDRKDDFSQSLISDLFRVISILEVLSEVKAYIAVRVIRVSSCHNETTFTEGGKYIVGMIKKLSECGHSLYSMEGRLGIEYKS